MKPRYQFQIASGRDAYRKQAQNTEGIAETIITVDTSDKLARQNQMAHTITNRKLDHRAGRAAEDKQKIPKR